MPDLDTLRARLGELARRRRFLTSTEGCDASGAEPTPAARSWLGRWLRPGEERTGAADGRARDDARARSGVGVEEYLPGGEWKDARGTVFVHERLRSQVEAPQTHWGRVEEPPATEPDLRALAKAGLERALFLDLETGGLASSPVFLAGTMHWNGTDFVVRQYFARHYGEEATLIGALAELARGFEFLVTFNGKSYDAPFLGGRAVVHGVALALPPRHVDLLHAARRRWKFVLPNCRLQTLELHVCRRRRAGDVPSDEVPGLYHDFVRRGDPYRLVPVFHHNLLDVITMAEILRALCEPLAPDEQPPTERVVRQVPIDGDDWWDGSREGWNGEPAAAPATAARALRAASLRRRGWHPAE